MEAGVLAIVASRCLKSHPAVKRAGESLLTLLEKESEVTTHHLM